MSGDIPTQEEINQFEESQMKSVSMLESLINQVFKSYPRSEPAKILRTEETSKALIEKAEAKRQRKNQRRLAENR